MLEKAQKLILNSQQTDFWEENGYLILRQALQPSDVDAVLAIVDEQWSKRKGNDHQIDVLSGPDDGKTFTMQDAQPSHRSCVYKLNNLFFRIPAIRQAAYHPVVRAALIASSKESH